MMPAGLDKTYQLYDDPLKFYNAILDDIDRAKKYIYLETYRFNNDRIGIKFRDALTRKSREGLEIMLLMDSWGTSLPASFFSELIKNGGQIRYFKKIKFIWNFFTYNHRRNHRKIIIIDDKISYIGSANLTDYSLNWRESILRINSDIAPLIKKVFLQHYKIYNNYSFDRGITIRKVSHNGTEIIRDIPSLTKQRIRKKYIELFKSARQQIVIETPYFLPSYYLRKALSDAAKRGVEVIIIVPRHSDVGLVDALRNRYFGPLFNNGIKFYFYLPHNLHAKLLLVDSEVYSIGSPNFDYRSFMYQHEIVMVGHEHSVIVQISEHIRETLILSEPFNYEEWQARSSVQKFFEWLILPFRHLL
jgi:cardiolipin synthase